MLPELRLIEQEIIPWLKETAAQTEKAAKAQLNLWAGKADKPLLLLGSKSPFADRLPHYNYEEIHWDEEKMFVTELRGALNTRAAMSASLPSVRANMGCGIYNTLMGMTQQLFPDKMPWIQEHLSKERLTALTPADIRLDNSKEFLAGLSHMRYIKKMLDGTGVMVYPLDLQGPIDIAHLALGDTFFYELYDDEDFIDHLLDLSATCMEVGGRAVLDVIGPEAGFVAHYNCLAMPLDRPLKISEDTSTLLSGDHIRRWALPTSERVLKHFGGGYMHYCGVNAHLLQAAMTSTNYIGYNFGNPEKHDMAKVVAQGAAAGKTYYGAAPMLDGEDRLAWMKRLCAASIAPDGHACLLLTAHCAPENIDAFKNDWLEAGGAAL